MSIDQRKLALRVIFGLLVGLMIAAVLMQYLQADKPVIPAPVEDKGRWINPYIDDPDAAVPPKKSELDRSGTLHRYASVADDHSSLLFTSTVPPAPAGSTGGSIINMGAFVPRPKYACGPRIPFQLRLPAAGIGKLWFESSDPRFAQFFMDTTEYKKPPTSFTFQPGLGGVAANQGRLSGGNMRFTGEGGVVFLDIEPDGSAVGKDGKPVVTDAEKMRALDAWLRACGYFPCNEKKA